MLLPVAIVPLVFIAVISIILIYRSSFILSIIDGYLSRFYFFTS